MIDDVKTKLLDAAQLLVQTRGHNGYSYRDLGEQIGIPTANIHYHFTAKADLAVALVRRYREALGAAQAKIAEEKMGLADRLDELVAVYHQCLRPDGRICVAAALVGEYASLPKEVQQELNRLMTDSQDWIARFLTEGRTRGELPPSCNPAALAQLRYGAMQGALVMARATEENTLAEVAAELKQPTLNQK